MAMQAIELAPPPSARFHTHRSQRIPGDVAKRVEHWRAVAIAARQNSVRRNRIPSVHAQSFE